MDTKERNSAITTVPNARDDACEKDTRNDSQADTRTESAGDIGLRLADHVGELRFLNSSLMVCVQALQQQDAEMDSDIALVLQRTVSDKLDETIDRIESIALGMVYEEA